MALGRCPSISDSNFRVPLAKAQRALPVSSPADVNVNEHEFVDDYDNVDVHVHGSELAGMAEAYEGRDLAGTLLPS
jgi:hypothetical protein